MVAGINISIILIVITILWNLFLAFSVLLKNPQKPSHRCFFILVLVLTFWIFCSFFANEPLGEYWQNILFRLDFVGGILGSYLFLLFVFHFPRRIGLPQWLVLRPLFLVSIFFSLVILFTNLVIQETRIVEGGIAYRSGPLDSPYAIFNLLLLTGGAIILLRQYQKTEGVERLQVFYLVIGAIIPVVILSSTVILLERFLNFDFATSSLVVSVIPRLALYSTAVFTFTASYAILRHRLFGIKVLLGKLIFWFFTALFLFTIFYLVVLSEQNLFGTFFTLDAILANIFLAIVLGVGFMLFEQRLQNFVNFSFSSFSFDPEETIRSFIVGAATADNYDEIVKKAFDIVQSCSVPLKQGILVASLDSGKSFSRWKNFSREEISLLEDKGTINAFFKSYGMGNLFLRSEIEGEKGKGDLFNIMQRLEVEITMFLRYKNLEGVYLLGRKVNKQAYTAEETVFLEKLSSEISANLSRTL